MSRVLPRIAAALALGLALTGCGAGLEAQTYQTRTVADGTNAGIGDVVVRNISVASADSGTLEAGSDATVNFAITNNGTESDRLVEATAALASSVDVVELDGERTLQSLEVPARGSTGTSNGLILRSLREDVRSGEYVEVVLRFERNGSLTVQVPVAVTGTYDDEREKSDNFHPPGSEGE